MSLKRMNIESLESLYSVLIDDVIRNSCLSSLFKNKEEMKFCMTTELDILKEYLISSSYNQQHYISLGYTYFQKDISLASTSEIVNYLQGEFVQRFCDTQDIQQIVQLYEVSMDFQTQGYFYASFDDFLNKLHKRVKRYNHTNMQPLFNMHLSWLENIYMEVKKTKSYDAMLVQNTPFTDKLIQYKNRYKEYADEFEQLLILYSRCYKQILILHHMLIKENYTRGYELVQTIELITVEMESTLSIINILEIEHENRYDFLTQALSRNLMLPIFEKEMEVVQISGKSLVVAMLDIDNFKAVNDTYGHLCGDEVLKDIVKICKNTLRGTDYIFRYGGEEFVILLNAVNLLRSIEIFELLRKKVADHTVLCKDERKVSVTVSIGVHHIRNPNKNDFLNFIEKADKNLYQAKSKGKNMVFY